ncbi:MAG: DUF1800 domain-containing protein, partial [Acidobacteriota bacterium]|nr:DUF1800 domain-containing protein [Acidobacteriota bacterium]
MRHTFTHRILAAALVLPLAAASTIDLGARQDDERALHVLNRIGFGPRPGDAARVQAMGIEKYIEAQLEPSKIDDRAVEAMLTKFDTLGLSTSEMVSRFYSPPQQKARQAQAARGTQGTESMTPPGQPETASMSPEDARQRREGNTPLLELSQQKILRAVYSERQLEEVLVDFWFNHFNVFSGKGQFARFYLTEYEREAIRPHVLGSFREMLGATAKSPAMLWYLDNWMSAAPQEEKPANARG